MCKFKLIRISWNTCTDGKATLLLQRPIYHCWHIGWIGSVRSCGHHCNAALPEKPRYPKYGDFTLDVILEMIISWNYWFSRRYQVYGFLGREALPSSEKASSILKIKAAGSSQTSVYVYQTTLLHIPEYCDLILLPCIICQNEISFSFAS
jgi:hypothetical protein